MNNNDKIQVIGKSSAISLGVLILVVGAAVFIVNGVAQTEANTGRIENLEATVMPREVLNEKFQGIYDRLDTMIKTQENK